MMKRIFGIKTETYAYRGGWLVDIVTNEHEGIRDAYLYRKDGIHKKHILRYPEEDKDRFLDIVDCKIDSCIKKYMQPYLWNVCTKYADAESIEEDKLYKIRFKDSDSALDAADMLYIWENDGDDVYAPTGITQLDKVAGGLGREMLSIVYGQSGAGKSTLLTEIMLNAIDTEAKALKQ